MRKPLLAVALSLYWVAPGAAVEPIKIGDLNSYASLPTFAQPYRDGWQLALERLNANGGVLGRPLEVVSRDDGGNPGAAVSAATDLISGEKVSVLMGTVLSPVGLAVAETAKQRRILFLAAEPLSDAIAWSKGNRYTFRLRAGTYVQAAMLAAEAAKLPAIRWATIAPDDAYGRSAVETFKALLKDERPEVKFVTEQWPGRLKLDAGPSVRALLSAKPDAVFNVTFGQDLVNFVREGTRRGLFDKREVVSLMTGEPEWNATLKDELPEGWIVTGYPWQDIETEAHGDFSTAYRLRFLRTPRMGSVIGYVALNALAKAIETAGSLETEALIAAMRGLRMETPFGPIMFRIADQQSTMGTFVGRTTLKDRVAGMRAWRFVDGADYLPPESDVEALRPAD